MKIFVLSVGKPKNRLFKSQVEEYHRRVAGSITCEWQVVPESVGKGSVPASIIEESAGILKKLSERDYFVLLDQDGDSMTSKLFSEWLFHKLGTISGRIVFVVGGPFGVSSQIQGRADRKVSLSDMTLTHEMSLLLLFEQIYRAITIERGGRYHH